MNKKTTKEQYKLFVSECKKWIRKFGLLGWRFYFEHNCFIGGFGRCCYPEEPAHRLFTLILNKDIREGDEYLWSNNFIKKVAFHEVMEAFLYRISYLGTERYIQPEEIPEERHNLIRTLESVIFDRE